MRPSDIKKQESCLIGSKAADSCGLFFAGELQINSHMPENDNLT